MLCTSLLSCATSSQPHQPEEKLCNIIPNPSTGGEVVQHHPSPINQRRSCATSSQTHQPEEKLCNIIPAPSTRGEVVQLHPRPGNRRRLCNFTRLKNYEMMFMVDVSTATGMTPQKMLHNFICATSSHPSTGGGCATSSQETLDVFYPYVHANYTLTCYVLV